MDRRSAWPVILPAYLLAAVAIGALAVALLRPCCCCCDAPNVHQGTLPHVEPGPLGAVPQLLREAGPELLDPDVNFLDRQGGPIYDRPSLKTPRVEDYPMVPPRPVAEVPEPSSAVLLAIMLLIAVAAARR